jgi:hypothetical protein
MGPGPKEQISTAGDITRQQLGIASEQSRREAESYSDMKRLMQPLITKTSALAGGDRGEALSAAMPVISQLSSGFHGARQQILNTMPAGAARDRALSDLTTQMFTNIGGAQARAVQEAPNILAGLGSEIGGYGLQQLGASLAALSGGAETNKSAMDARVAQQRALLNFFGSLAQAAGGAASAGIATSDRRLKRNVRGIDHAVTPDLIESLLRVDPRMFDFKDGPVNQVGVIAQELQAVLPELVSTGEDGYLRVNYAGLAALCLAALRLMVRPEAQVRSAA